MKKSGEWEYRVRFMEAEVDMLEFVAGEKEMPKRIRKQVTRLTAGHRNELLQEWENKVIQDENI